MIDLLKVLAIGIIASSVILGIEVLTDYRSIFKRKGDKHLTDVVLAILAIILVSAFTSIVVVKSWAGFAIPIIYSGMRFLLFNKLLNWRLGLPRDYLSDRGWDKIYSKFPKNIRKEFEIVIGICTILAFILAYLAMA